MRMRRSTPRAGSVPSCGEMCLRLQPGSTHKRDRHRTDQPTSARCLLRRVQLHHFRQERVGGLRFPFGLQLPQDQSKRQCQYTNLASSRTTCDAAHPPPHQCTEGWCCASSVIDRQAHQSRCRNEELCDAVRMARMVAVSYTHLTLPTKRIV